MSDRSYFLFDRAKWSEVTMLLNMECQGVLMRLICEMWAREKQQVAQFSLHDWKDIFGASAWEVLGLLVKMEQSRVLAVKIENAIITVNFPDWLEIAVDPETVQEQEG